jgi:hypothetical protein
MPNTPTKRDNTLTIGLVLAGVVAVLILAGSVFFKADQSGDVTSTQPTTESPTTGDTKTP